MNLFNKIKPFFKPSTMYKVNIGGAFANIVFALASWAFGLPAAYAQIFIASGLCFLVGAVANWWMMKIQSKK